jgi:hypothetical protein
MFTFRRRNRMRFRFSRPELILQAPCRKSRLFPGYNAFRKSTRVEPATIALRYMIRLAYCFRT